MAIIYLKTKICSRSLVRSATLIRVVKIPHLKTNFPKVPSNILERIMMVTANAIMMEMANKKYTVGGTAASSGTRVYKFQVQDEVILLFV